MNAQDLNISEAQLFGSLKAGPISASLLALCEEPGAVTPAFCLWRWVKTPGGWKRSEKFRASDVERLLHVLAQVEAWASATALEKTVRKESLWRPTPKAGDVEAALSIIRDGRVELLVFEKEATPGGAAWFRIRRPVDALRHANWFLRSDISSIEAVRLEARRWFLDEDRTPEQ
jgi:hypothetical protein